MKRNNDAIFMLDLMRSFISSTNPEKELTESVINYCIQFRLGPILTETYLKHAKLVPAELKEKLLSIALTAKYYSASHQAAISELITHANNLGIKLILLKGIDLSRSLYKHPHLRLMGDIDILVEEKHAQTIAGFLTSVGYLQESTMPDSFYETHQHLKPFRHPQTGIWVEVHTRLFSLSTPQGRRKIFKPEQLFKKLTPTNQVAGIAFAIKPEINLLYTITHWIREFKVSNSMIQLIDIALLISKRDINWSEFLEYVNTRDHTTEIKLVFWILGKYNLVSIPHSVCLEIKIKKDSMGIFGKWLLTRIILAYLHQNKFITQVIGPTNTSRIWDSYLRDRNSLTNHIHAIHSTLFVSDIESQSVFTIIVKRIKRFLHRGFASLKKQ